MKGKGLGFVPFVFAFVAKRLDDFHQNLGFHWSQVPNNLVTFDIHIWTRSRANYLYVRMTCFFDWDWGQANTYIVVVYGILTTFEHCMPLITTKGVDNPKFHRTQQRLMQKWWWKNYSLHLWHMQKHVHWTCVLQAHRSSINPWHFKMCL